MVVILLDRPFPADQLGASADLDLGNVGAKVWPKVLSTCQATDLTLYHLTLTSLEGIEALVHVRLLKLEWATKIEQLAPVFRMRSLNVLSIFDFPKVRQLSGIEALGELSELSLSGNRGSGSPPLRLASIGPLAGMPGLAKLSLTNLVIEDDDVTVLARCSGLRHLHLSNQFELAQVAYLAKRLNAQLTEPLVSHRASSQICAKCGGSKSMLTGRRKPILCPVCDEPRLESHMREFDRLLRDA